MAMRTWLGQRPAVRTPRPEIVIWPWPCMAFNPLGILSHGNCRKRQRKPSALQSCFSSSQKIKLTALAIEQYTHFECEHCMKIDDLLELLLYFSCILRVTDNAFRLLSVYRLYFDSEFALFASKHPHPCMCGDRKHSC